MADEKDSNSHIVVDGFTGGASGTDLIECYFKRKHDGTYTFHDKDDKEKCKDLTCNGNPSCSFSLDEEPNITWTLTLTTCSVDLVEGNWSNTVSNPEGEEGGTFTAQGGTIDAETAASASSY
jgi:hypothetical protein